MNFKKTYSSLAAAFALAAMVSCSKDETPNVQTLDEPQASQSYSELIPDQFIVVFKEPGKMKGDHVMNRLQVQEKSENVFKSKGVSEVKILEVYSATLSGVAVKMSKNDALKLSKSDDVAYVEQDRIIALAPPCGTKNGSPCEGDGGGDGGTSTQETPYGITRVNGGVTYTGNGVAWILDTGIDLDHEDLNVDASRGFNAFTSGKDAGSLDDGNGHGTHVAGTIAAVDNNVGVIGVAAGATVIPVKVLDSRGSGSYSGVIAGVDHVGANGVEGDVANMSLGGPGNETLDNAIITASAKVKFALAAGNDGDDASKYSPARVNGTNIVTISAVDINDNFASWSNWGSPVDYAAPGVSIKSTWKDGGYNTISGTSMAAPHAAGIWLLGNISTSGTANGDPHDPADPIAVH